MEDPRQTRAIEPIPNVWPQQWSDLRVLIVLLVLVLGIRTTVMFTTEVPARDSIGFIRYALLFEKQSWRKVIQDSHQHPGYPVCVMVTSWPIRWWTGRTDCYTMQYSAQLASVFAGWLLTIPLFYLGKYFYNRAVGFWSVLLFQCLPASGQMLSDAISDPLFLCLVATALLFGVYAIHHRSLWQFLLCGFFSGLTYLVRPEGIFAMVAAGLILVGFQFVPRWRRSWSSMFACGFSLLLGAIIAASPYFLVTGSFSNKPSVKRFTDQIVQNEQVTSTTGPLFATLFGMHIDTDGSLPTIMWRGLVAMLTELVQSLQYIGWLPAAVCLWWHWRRFQERPGFRVAHCYFLLQAVSVWWLAVNVGYVSDRHIQPLVMISVSVIVAVVVQAPFKFWQLARTGNWTLAALPIKTAWSFRLLSIVGVLLMAAWIGSGVSRVVQPLHAHRAGHRAAGLWLRDNTYPADWIIDDHSWAHYYAGRVFSEGETAVNPTGVCPCRFVVYSRPKDRNNIPRGRGYSEVDLQKQGGQPVYLWPEQTTFPKAKVVVYRIGPRRD